MIKRYIYMTILLLLFCTAIGNSGDMYVPTGISTHLSVAQMGMGGLTTTIGTNAHTLFYNPALLNRQRFSLEIPTIGLGLDNDAFNVINFIDDHQDEFDNFDSLTAEEQAQFIMDSQEFDNKWVGVQVTPYLGFAIKNIGVGAYGVSQADVKIDQGVMVPALGLRGYMDFVVGAGYGREMDIMGKTFELGITARYVNRRIVEPMRINAQDANNADEIVQTAIDELENTKTGFGIDVGMIRTMEFGLLGPKAELDYGIVVQDLIGSLDGYVKPNVKIGAMAHMPFGGSWLLPRWDVGIEMVDFFNRQGVNLFQRINMGTELCLLKGLFKLRGGFHQGYPTAGIGFKLVIISVDYAYFIRELGTKPGQFDEGTHRFQLSLGF